MNTLTKNEQNFVNTFAKENWTGCETWSDLTHDNGTTWVLPKVFSFFPNLTESQVGGYLSSLEKKGVMFHEDDYDGCGAPRHFGITCAYVENQAQTNPNTNF
jgi:hypothetical protein